MLAMMTRTEPKEHIDRWYSVLVQPTLIEHLAVIRAWGIRQTAWQQMRILPVESVKEARALASKMVERKIRRGCRCVWELCCFPESQLVMTHKNHSVAHI